MPHGDGYDPVGLQHPSVHYDEDAQRPSQSREASYSTAAHSANNMSYPPRRVQLADEHGATSPAAPYPFASGAGPSSSTGDNPYFTEKRMPEPTHHSSSPSGTIFTPIKKFESDFGDFHSRNASEAHLQFAEGDLPTNKVTKFYHYLLNVSIFTRWILFIVPMLGIIWIPGILQLTTYPDAQVWSVHLIWWSIWLSVVWAGWWCAIAAARMLPVVLRYTVGIVALATRRYFDWASALHRYVALFAWTMACWISFNPLIDRHVEAGASEKNERIISFIARLLFGVFLCSCVLLFEKFSIQWIAGKFHERSYAERIAEQKAAVKALVVMYRNSQDIPGRTDTLRAGHLKKGSVNPRHFFKQALKGVRNAATTTTTALGNVASEIAGTSVLQPNSPQAMVKTALESANKSRLLARRLFYSFAKSGSDHLLLTDVARFFPNREEAERAFSLFDRDSNGDALLEEVEMACMDVHREQLSIEHSMQDLDSAVGRLDNIFMSLYVIVAALIIAVVLDAEVATLLTSASTLVLGLSWLIGSSLSEVLISIIFLFIKHPFDVGDRVIIAKDHYTVKEIRLLSTIFLDGNGTYVQAPNSGLNAQFIQNIRRSPVMSETFTFDVAYSTSFDDLEELRKVMLKFLEANKREYMPSFDVKVVDFPEQEKMTLSADIKHKSNLQMGSIASARRNKWIIALKTSLGEVGIYGPAGPPASGPALSRFTQVPYETVLEQDRIAAEEERLAAERLRLRGTHGPNAGWQLSDNNVLGGSTSDVFGEQQELMMPTPRRGLSSGASSIAGPAMPPAAAYPMQPRERFDSNAGLPRQV